MKNPLVDVSTRLCGVLVTAVPADGHNATALRVGDYFTSTLGASHALGFKADVLGRALRRSQKPGRAAVGGVEFETVKLAYQNAKEMDICTHPLLQAAFPWLFREDGSVIWNLAKARADERRERMSLASALTVPPTISNA